MKYSYKGIHILNINQIYSRLSINTGIKSVSIPGASHSIFVPKTDWVAAQDYVVNNLSGTCPLESEQNYISLVKIPKEISDYLSIIGHGLSVCNSAETISLLFKDIYYKHGCNMLFDWVSKRFDPNVHFLGHYYREPNLESVSINHENQFVGLHIDSFSNLPITERRNERMRLCVNLGSEPRFLTFINLSLKELMRFIAIASPINEFKCPNKLVRDFFELYPNFPVFRLQINPLEGYIAPTELIIHDANTMGRSFFDVSVTLLGQYPSSIANIYSV